MKVIIRRAWSLYAGLPLGLMLSFLFISVSMCKSCSTPDITSFIAAIVATLAIHEALHYVVGRLIGVNGLRLRFLLKLTAIVVEYDRVTPHQYVAMALAPHVLTIFLIMLILTSTCTPIPLCAALIVNLVGSGPDTALAMYYGIRHRRACFFKLLYDEKGAIVGGVVEYSDRLVVYIF